MVTKSKMDRNMGDSCRAGQASAIPLAPVTPVVKAARGMLEYTSLFRPMQ